MRLFAGFTRPLHLATLWSVVALSPCLWLIVPLRDAHCQADLRRAIIRAMSPLTMSSASVRDSRK